MIAAFLLSAAAASSTAIAQPLLQPWASLVGHCWQGPVPDGSTDRHCFEAVYGGQHIRDRHVVIVGGHDVYEGETLYSAKGNQVIFTYWNSLGGLGTGEATFAGGVWTFRGTVHGSPTSPEQPIALSWTIRPDGYEVDDGSSAPRLFKRAD